MALLGDSMGQPLECEHANPANGDSLQRTTTGLAFYRQATNTPTFTTGGEHWALTSDGLQHWTGTNIDPPTMLGFEVLVGDWRRRDSVLHVFSDGSARFNWRRSQDPFNGFGGEVEMAFTDVGSLPPLTGIGSVTFASDTGIFSTGQIYLTYTSDSLVLLEQPGTSQLWFCRPPADLNGCGPDGSVTQPTFTNRNGLMFDVRGMTVSKHFSDSATTELEEFR
jgi:hypothetical protein